VGLLVTGPRRQRDNSVRIPEVGVVGWLIVVIVVLIVAVVAFVITRRRRRGGGVIATKGKR
jgi:hypothetical protein